MDFISGPLDRLWWSIWNIIAVFFWQVDRILIMAAVLIHSVRKWITGTGDRPEQSALYQVINSLLYDPADPGGLRMFIYASLIAALLVVAVTYAVRHITGSDGGIVDLKKVLTWLLVIGFIFSQGPTIFTSLENFRAGLSSAAYTVAINGARGVGGYDNTSNEVPSGVEPMHQIVRLFPITTQNYNGSTEYTGVDVAAAYLLADQLDISGASRERLPTEALCRYMYWQSDCSQPSPWPDNASADQRAQAISNAQDGAIRMGTGIIISIFAVMHAMIFLFFGVSAAIYLFSAIICLVFVFFKPTEGIMLAVVKKYVQLMLQTYVVSIVLSLLMGFLIYWGGGGSATGVKPPGLAAPLPAGLDNSGNPWAFTAVALLSLYFCFNFGGMAKKALTESFNVAVSGLGSVTGFAMSKLPDPVSMAEGAVKKVGGTVAGAADMALGAAMVAGTGGAAAPMMFAGKGLGGKLLGMGMMNLFNKGGSEAGEDATGETAQDAVSGIRTDMQGEGYNFSGLDPSDSRRMIADRYLTSIGLQPLYGSTWGQNPQLNWAQQGMLASGIPLGPADIGPLGYQGMQGLQMQPMPADRRYGMPGEPESPYGLLYASAFPPGSIIRKEIGTDTDETGFPAERPGQANTNPGAAGIGNENTSHTTDGAYEFPSPSRLGPSQGGVSPFSRPGDVDGNGVDDDYQTSVDVERGIRLAGTERGNPEFGDIIQFLRQHALGQSISQEKAAELWYLPSSAQDRWGAVANDGFDAGQIGALLQATQDLVTVLKSHGWDNAMIYSQFTDGNGALDIGSAAVQEVITRASGMGLSYNGTAREMGAVTAAVGTGLGAERTYDSGDLYTAIGLAARESADPDAYSVASRLGVSSSAFGSRFYAVNGAAKLAGALGMTSPTDIATFAQVSQSLSDDQLASGQYDNLPADQQMVLDRAWTLANQVAQTHPQSGTPKAQILEYARFARNLPHMVTGRVVPDFPPASSNRLAPATYTAQAMGAFQVDQDVLPFVPPGLTIAEPTAPTIKVGPSPASGVPFPVTPAAQPMSLSNEPASTYAPDSLRTIPSELPKLPTGLAETPVQRLPRKSRSTDSTQSAPSANNDGGEKE